jgi:hypothetical protein
VPLFIFIDAGGWEIIKNDSFADSFASTRKRLESVFGYSSACAPSILSGRWPVEHRNWSYFIYDPKNSPFGWLRKLNWLPTCITSRRRFRRWLSKFVKTRLSFRGYFDLYNIPFRHISLFDFSEKQSPLQLGGMNEGENIFDFLEARGIAYHVSKPTDKHGYAALLTNRPEIPRDVTAIPHIFKLMTQDAELAKKQNRHHAPPAQKLLTREKSKFTGRTVALCFDDNGGSSPDCPTPGIDLGG